MRGDFVVVSDMFQVSGFPDIETVKEAPPGLCLIKTIVREVRASPENVQPSNFR